ATEEREENKRARILVVDDEVMVSQGLEALLRARGYEVELVHDGPGALARLHHDPLPDLVLLDFELPGLDGLEVLTRMRQDARTVRTPVLMATAAKIQMGALPNVSGVLHKPYPRQVLFELIARLLDDDGQGGPNGTGSPAPDPDGAVENESPGRRG
ncbi:MAG: response regulator, partial [Planctomycetota bacterium]